MSTIAVPFRLHDDRIACLTLYGSSIDIWSSQEQKLLQEITCDLGFGSQAIEAAIAKIRYQVNLRESLELTIQILADTVGERDPYTAGHQRRVAKICTQIATELGLSADCIHGLHLAATIHDLGKIGIPSEILSKPRRLTATEFELVKDHSSIAFNILKLKFPKN
jgi:HD-GYP domain-containing protein (c-di-GMP phosphodiesterase class II)